MATNHYVKLKAIDCGSSVDADGYCVFDSKGNLPPGVGTFTIDNSWGVNWGDKGRIKTLITSASGKRCNNIAGGEANAQILDVGLPMPEDRPVDFVVESRDVMLKATLNPGSGFTEADAKKALEAALSSLEAK